MWLSRRRRPNARTWRRLSGQGHEQGFRCHSTTSLCFFGVGLKKIDANVESTGKFREKGEVEGYG
jgi:hypothetical protein